MNFDRRTWAALGLVFISFFGLMSASANQETEEENALKRGALLYQFWDQVLRVDLVGNINPLWQQQEFSDQPGPFTWRCVSCHGWDYLGADGEFGPGAETYTGFPGLLGVSEMSAEELAAWLDGSENPAHDFSDFLTVAAQNDLIYFLQEGLVDFSRYAEIESFEEMGSSLNGEELYKAACRECHGADGARVNFGTADNLSFLGNLAENSPWHMVHVIRFGHFQFDSIKTSEELGWSRQDLFDVVVYLQQLPKGQQLAEEIQILSDQDYLYQADTGPLIAVSAAMVLLVYGAVYWFRRKS